ncbi:MAG: PKD domain-containing protein [Verrucomicrobia bacterium]|nr:PKD domain-containing protein [Verrucomicrobiota bacterium]
MKTNCSHALPLLLSLTGLLYLVPVLPAQLVNDAGQVFPDVKISHRVHGKEIAGALGSRLSEVARFYKRSEADLRSLCEKSPSLHVGRSGHLHYVCQGLVAPAGALTASAPTANAAAAPFPLSQTFLLHSRPGAQRVIYLDFDGNTTKGTYWNSDNNVASIVTPPYDTDGNAAVFGNTELANIQEIWQRVAEDYAPFEVDVTTQDPGLEAIRKTSSTDQFYGIRVCIGGSSDDWYGGGAGGVTYMTSFGWDIDTPAFVFPKDLGSSNAKYISEAIAHEVGHGFGLDHDGQTNGTEYYDGHGNWAPIMGGSYDRAIVQWSKGEYPLANNKEDDLAIIAKMAPFRADQNGNDILHATMLTGTSFNASGIIEQRTDADLFGFTTGAGSITFTVTGATPSPNLNAQLSLYDGSGNLVTSVNPGANLGATLTTTVKQGTYYIAVDGVGFGTTSTGFNDYGSIGQYSLKGTVVSSTGTPPVAVATSSTPLSGVAPATVYFSSAGSADPDGSIVKYDWDFGDGTTSTLPNPAHVYTAAGTYTASLVVYDNTGLSASTSVTLTVTPPVTAKSLHVAEIKMSLYRSRWYGYYAGARVIVRNQAGVIVPGATVTGKWSGLTLNSASGKTDSTGVITLWSNYYFGRGTFTFTVTGITLTGYSYAPSQNVKTQGSVTAF